MAYDIKPLPFDPKNIKGLSEKLLISHYENNYSGAVRRLNTLTAQLAELDFAKAPVFTLNGLKREELIASNSMILHELYFDGLGNGGAPTADLADAITRDFGSMDRWRAEFEPTTHAKLYEMAYHSGAIILAIGTAAGRDALPALRGYRSIRRPVSKTR